MAKKPNSPKDEKAAAAPQTGNGAPKNPALKELQEFYQFMQQNGLEALEIDRKGFRVRLVRQGRAAAAPAVYHPAPGTAAPTAPATPAAPPAAPALPPNAVVIKAPMMGIFYRAASPSSPPFVKEGDTVKAGDVLCLIEAMKVFNDVKSELSGTVLKFCLENGKSVKVGQDLLVIERK